MKALQYKYDNINSIQAVLREYLDLVPDAIKPVEHKQKIPKNANECFDVVTQFAKIDDYLKSCYSVVTDQDPENMSGISHSTSVKLKDMQVKIIKTYTKYINTLPEINESVYHEMIDILVESKLTPESSYELVIKYPKAFDLYVFFVKHELETAEPQLKYEYIKYIENYKKVVLDQSDCQYDYFKTGHFVPVHKKQTIDQICELLSVDKTTSLPKLAKSTNINIVVFVRLYGTIIYYDLPDGKKPDIEVVDKLPIRKSDIQIEIHKASKPDKTIFLETVEPGFYNVMSIWESNFILSYSFSQGFWNYIKSPTKSRSGTYHELQIVPHMFLNENLFSSHESIKIDLDKLAGNPKYIDYRQDIFSKFYKWIDKRYDKQTPKPEVYDIVISAESLNEFMTILINFIKPNINIKYLPHILPKIIETRKLFFKALEDGFNKNWPQTFDMKNHVDVQLIMHNIIREAIFATVDKNDLLMCEAIKWENIENAIYIK